MTLRDTVSKWHTAMCLLDENRLDEAAHKLLEIQKPSARIFYNLGLICMLQHRYRDAIQYFNTSIDQDKYLAIAFYQRGLCLYELQRFDAARSDFLSAQSMIRHDGIDYKQLGAEIILSSQLLEHCVTVTEESLSKKQTRSRLQALPVRACVLRPQKVLVDNLDKQTFLGNAKVISSAKAEDIVPALEARKAHDHGVKIWASASVPSSPASPRHAFSTPSAKRIFIPPPPKRPPPRLPSGTPDSQQLRLKSKSLENMTLNDATNQPLSVEEKLNMLHMVSPKPRRDRFDCSSSVADTLSQDTDVSAHLLSDNSDRVSDVNLSNSSVMRNHVTDILTGQLNVSNMQTPSRLNHAPQPVVLDQNERGNPGHVSGGHAAKMKLLFERAGKPEEKLSQKGIPQDNQKCKLDSELQETIVSSQKNRFDVIQQSKSGDSWQNRANKHQYLSSSSSSIVPGSNNIQKSPKPVRPPPPKSSK